MVEGVDDDLTLIIKQSVGSYPLFGPPLWKEGLASSVECLELVQMLYEAFMVITKVSRQIFLKSNFYRTGRAELLSTGDREGVGLLNIGVTQTLQHG